MRPLSVPFSTDREELRMDRVWLDGAGAVAIREMNGEELAEFVGHRLHQLEEDEAIAVLANRFCTAPICSRIASVPRLTAYYDVKLRLVACRSSPQHVSHRFVRHLYWSDLVRLSTDVMISPAVRRVVDQQLLMGLPKLALGEKISMARMCGREVSKILMKDPDRKVFGALLDNPRMREEDLVGLIRSGGAHPEKLRLISDHRKWGTRYAIRLALIFNPSTPKACGASQIRYLTEADRRELRKHPQTSTYIRTCLDRFEKESG
jgi:hypothetical protein